MNKLKLSIGNIIKDTIDNNTYKVIELRNDGYVLQNINSYGPIWESGTKRYQKYFFSFESLLGGLKQKEFILEGTK